jgi:hypothetical protein
MQFCQTDQNANFFFLDFGIQEKKLYPLIQAPLSIISFSNSIQVSVNISFPGFVSCAALSSIEENFVNSYLISTKGESSYFKEATSLVTIILKNLAAETNYYIFCYTEDFFGNKMFLNDILNTRKFVITSCCRSLSFTTTLIDLPQYNPNDRSSNTKYYFKLDSIPNELLMVKLISSLCDINSISSLPRIFPSTFSYDATSYDLISSFVIQAYNPGCFYINAQITSSSQNYIATNQIKMNVYSVNQLPAPSLKSVIFSNDGISLTLSFSSKAVCFDNCDGLFKCNSMLSFNGSVGAICQWLDQHSIRIVPSNNNTDNILPGEYIILLPGKIKRVCESVDSGDCYNY